MKPPRGRTVSRWAASACAAACALVASAQAQTLYKCLQPGGRVLYQQEPCADATKQSTVRPPDPVASKTAEELKAAEDSAAKAAETEMNAVIRMMADLSLCVGDVPGFDDKHGAAIQQWKARNGKAVARFDRDREARSKAVARMDAERARLKAPGALAANCERVAGSLGTPAPAAPKK